MRTSLCLESVYRMGAHIFEYNQSFVVFGIQHMWVLGLIAGLSWALPWLAQKRLNANQRRGLARGMGLVLTSSVIAWTGLRLIEGAFDPTTDLPLDLCNLLAFLMPLLIWRPTQRIQEVLYFWVLAGTVQAVLTPHLVEGFPHYTFLKYWIVHGGLVVVTIYVTVAFRLYPTGRSLIRAFVGIQFYAVGIFVVNKLLGANYFYIMEKPPTASLLDYFGPWPWYILVCEGIMLVLFLIAYAPIWLRARRLRLVPLASTRLE